MRSRADHTLALPNCERMIESDLYSPVKCFLQAQGYEVKGEVLHCDIVAVRDDEDPVVVELKRSLGLQLLLQAVDRLAISQHVYVGVPASLTVLTTQRKRLTKLLRMLGLGLLAVDVSSQSVSVLLDPGPYRGVRASPVRKQRLLGEFQRRVGDPNLGGSTTKRGRVTVHRQRAVAIGLVLLNNGATKASDVARTVNDPKARDILYRNVYGWFERVDQGIYALSPRGQTEILDWSGRV